jgi:hypothetical protein
MVNGKIKEVGMSGRYNMHGRDLKYMDFDLET